MSFFCNPVWTEESWRVCRNSRRLLNDPRVFGTLQQMLQPDFGLTDGS